MLDDSTITSRHWRISHFSFKFQKIATTNGTIACDFSTISNVPLQNNNSITKSQVHISKYYQSRKTFLHFFNLVTLSYLTSTPGIPKCFTMTIPKLNKPMRTGRTSANGIDLLMN